METHDENKTFVEVIKGAQYERGLTNPHFVTNKDKGTVELDNPYVLLVENKIENIRQIQGVLEFIIKGNKSLLIIAEMEPTVTSALAMNKIQGNIKVNVIDPPVYGVNKQKTLHDLSLITGATIINEDLGDDMDMLTEEHLGSCVKSVTDNAETILQVHELSEEVEDLILSLKDKLQKETNPNLVLSLEKRLARLAGKVAIVKSWS